MASSPMTVHSGDAPTLTVGTTADTSPSPLSPISVPDSDAGSLRARSRSVSLTPPPDEKKAAAKKKAPASKANGSAKAKATKPRASAPAASTAKTPTKAAAGTKRKSLPAAAAAEATPKKKAKKEPEEKAADDDKPEKGTYCHQCRTKCEPESVIRCTRLRKYTKHSAPRACNLAWCERDLEKRYDISPAELRERGLDVSSDELAKHDADKGYIFACPCCLDECQNSTCRIKKGLPRLGDVVKFAAEQGISPLEYVRKVNAEGPAATGKSREDAESDLTDLDAPARKKKAPAKKEIKAAPATKKTAKGKETKKEKEAKAKEAKVKAAAAKKAKDAKVKEAKKEVKEKKIPEEKPVDPPFFNMANSKLSYEDVEHRIYLREFVNRFRGLLRIPDRSLSHLDDFDHPLNEAIVRGVAGGLLDLIVEDNGDSSDLDPDWIDFVGDKREELRHYADLARFAQVYKDLAEPLGLKMLDVESARDRNDRAVRALLDLGDNEPAPSWALETGPSRRAAASRLPSASEVVRMLIALTDNVIHLQNVRSTMDPAVGNSYTDYLRKNVAENKEENARWETEKKALMAARVRCKSAEQTKANKAKYDAEYARHNMILRAGQVALNIVAARKQTRFAPLGTDPDGRIYYALTPRLIDEERYRPSGWTRGVIVWGPGIEEQAAESELPTKVPRWSYFSTAVDVRLLANWIGYRVRKAVQAAEADEAKRAKELKKTPKKAANGSAAASASASKNASRRTSLVFDGVVLPAARKKSVKTSDDSGDESDADSELSDAPETREDLLKLLNPPGYVPGVEEVKEGFSLMSAVMQVANLLEVLEFKGYA